MTSLSTGKALGAYRSVGVSSLADTASPNQLVLMLFNGASAAVAAARGHMERKEIAAKGKAISSAISIIDGGLRVSLDLKVGGELAQNLSDLYVYMGQRLFHANAHNDPRALEEVAQLLKQLGSAWETIAGKSPMVAAVAMPPMPEPRLIPKPGNRVSAAYGAV